MGRFVEGVNGDYSHIKLGKWGYHNVNEQVANLNISTADRFEPDKNWQCTETFAEDGKHKAVVNFYDGMHRNRQTITHQSTEGVTVAVSSAFDDEGRPVIDFLPAVLPSIDLHYINELNQGTSGTYGPNDIFNVPEEPAQLANDVSGASAYYSNQNPFLNDLDFRESHAFVSSIPDAQGYPFSQVEFMRDGTGRVLRSGGPGAAHQLGNHDTRYYYGTPTSSELHRLFGSQVGEASHYKKNVTIDPNGSATVAYLDQEGRTIATALAGETPASLVSLANDDPIQLKKNLNENNTYDPITQTYKSRTVFVNLKENAAYDFHYDLMWVVAALSLEDPVDPAAMPTPDFCMSCAYELTIRITKPDGLPLPINNADEFKTTFQGADACGNANFAPAGVDIDGLIFAELGDYTVEKVLRLLPRTEDRTAHLDNLLQQTKRAGGYD